ncbi:MAG TPA: VTT domain-containing protein [Myxococcales bacterium]
MSKTSRLVIALAALCVAGLVLEKLPILRLVVDGAKAVHGRGLLGALATCAAVYALTLFLFPVVPLIVACGWLYGVMGTLLTLPAAVASAATSFSVARALGKSAAARALLQSPRAAALAELAAEGGIKTVALVRLAPILPFTPSNAVLGLTAMRLRDIALGTFFGMAPGIVLYSWAGSLLPSAEAIESGAPLHARFVWALFAVAFAAAAILGIAAARRLRQKAVAAKRAGAPTDRS